MLKAILQSLSLTRRNYDFDSSYLSQQSPEMRRMLPRSFDSMEIWLLMFCGLYGLLVCSFILIGVSELKLMCIGFLLLAIAKRYKPARTKNQWFLGALLALLLTACIYMAPSSGGSAGPFLFLLLLMAMGYPLLMDKRMALAFGLVLVSVYYLSAAKEGGGAARNLLLLRGLLLGGICFMSARFGAVLRQAEETMDSMRRDKESLVYNEHGLNHYGERLVERCERNASPCTLVLLRMPMSWLSDVTHEQDPLLLNQLHVSAVKDIAANIHSLAPQGSLLARSSEYDWVLLVPGMNRASAIDLLVAKFGRPLQIPFGLKQLEWFVAITPCAVEVTEEYPTVSLMLNCAETIWERGFNTGVV